MIQLPYRLNPLKRLLVIKPPRDRAEQVLAATLQGVWNRTMPSDSMIYLEYDQHAHFWRDFYSSAVLIEEGTLENALYRAVRMGIVGDYLTFDPEHPENLNDLCNFSGLRGGALIAPNSLHDKLQRAGLRHNQPPPGYKLTPKPKSAFVWNHNSPGEISNPGIYELAVNQGLYCTDLNPTTEQQKFQAMLQTLGAGTVMYGWGIPGNDKVWNEHDCLAALSANGGMHSGIGAVAPGAVQLGNLTVHAAMSAYYPQTYSPRPHFIDPALMARRNEIVTLAFCISDMDQLAVLLGLVIGKDGASLWPERGALPLTWGFNSAALKLFGGVLDYYMHTIHPRDDFISVAPAGYFYPGECGTHLPGMLRQVDDDMRNAGLSSAALICNARARQAKAFLRAVPAANLVLDGYGPSGPAPVWVGDQVYCGVSQALEFNSTGFMGTPEDAAHALHYGIHKGGHDVPGLKGHPGARRIITGINWGVTPKMIAKTVRIMNALAKSDDPGRTEDFYVPVTVRDQYELMKADRNGAI